MTLLLLGHLHIDRATGHTDRRPDTRPMLYVFHYGHGHVAFVYAFVQNRCVTFDQSCHFFLQCPSYIVHLRFSSFIIVESYIPVSPHVPVPTAPMSNTGYAPPFAGNQLWCQCTDFDRCRLNNTVTIHDSKVNFCFFISETLLHLLT